MNNNYQIFKELLIDYDKSSSKEFINRIGNSKENLSAINRLFYHSLTAIGDDWNAGKLSLAQVYMSGVLCEELINEIFDSQKKETTQKPDIAVVTFSDFHTLGKKILYSQLTVSGYNIADFGQISDIEILAERCIKEEIKILLISVLMLPSALRIKELRASFKEKDHEIIIIVGGAPFIFNPSLYKQVEADDTGKTPADAMKLIDKWSTNNKKQ